MKLNISTDIFKYLNKINTNNKNERVDTSIALLRRLIINKENKEADFYYCLKRLFRGCGSGTTDSRTSFFVALTGLLRFTSNDEPSCENILEMASKELPYSKVPANKEDSDAIVGMILVCGAIILSNKFNNEKSTSKLNLLVTKLIELSKYKTYHKLLAFSFLLEISKLLSEKEVKKNLWPLLASEIESTDRNLEFPNIFILTGIYKLFPSSGAKEILEKNYDSIAESILDDSNYNIRSIKSAIEYLSWYLINCSNLKDFWTEAVETKWNKNISRNTEITLIKIIVQIFKNTNRKLSFLLSDNLIKLIVKTLKSWKPNQKSNPNEENIKTLYEEFFESVVIYCSKDEVIDDEERLLIIKKLILYPGLLNIESFTKQKIIHQISSKVNDEVKIFELFEVYENILLNKINKDPVDSSIKWLQTDKKYAGYMMQYLINLKQVQTSYKWKTQKLESIMKLGFFFVDTDFNVIKNEPGSSLLEIDEELTEQMRSIFYSSIQSKIVTLKSQEKMLYNLAEIINSFLNKKNYSKYFHIKIDDNQKIVWTKMFGEIQKLNLHKKDSTKKVSKNQKDYVFSILLLHMGIQIFKDPKMAETSIADLEVCMKKAKELENFKSNDLDSKDEPKWIEVIIDLFLHLLSQNSNCLKNIVISVLPHLSEDINLTSIHQILEIFTDKVELNDNDIEMNSEDESDMSDDQNDSEINEEERNSDTDEESSEEDDDEDNDEEEDSKLEKFRNTISFALKENNLIKEDDADSIDLDNIDEEEGRKFDEILSAAFRARKEEQNQNKKVNKKSKEYKLEQTTLLHFRIRVLDLIDSYLSHKPSLIIILEILNSLFNALENFLTKESELLCAKIQKIIIKITNIKKFENTIDNDLTQEDLFNYFINILNKKYKSKHTEMNNEIKSKIIVYLIYINELIFSTKTNKKTDFEKKIIKEFENIIKDFVSLKNSSIGYNFFKYFFENCSSQKLVHSLMKIQISFVSEENIIALRRSQIFELLSILYKNQKLLQHDKDLNLKNFKIYESTFQSYFDSIVNNEVLLTPKEFSSMLDLILTFTNFHKKNNSVAAFNMEKEMLVENIQKFRGSIKLDNLSSYKRFCSFYNIKPIKNQDVSQTKTKEIPVKEKLKHKKNKDKKRKAPSDEINGTEKIKKMYIKNKK